ncbi:unnamed protein product [Ixodes persulcatus]
MHRVPGARSVSVAMAVSVFTECVFCEWSTLEGPPVCGRSSIFAVVDVQNSFQETAYPAPAELRGGVEATLALDMGSFIARAAHMVQKAWNGGDRGCAPRRGWEASIAREIPRGTRRPLLDR